MLLVFSRFWPNLKAARRRPSINLTKAAKFAVGRMSADILYREEDINPPVSVLIPTYNEERFLPLTLEALFKQT
jgi:cellulose synthase/poly-beta-1,6-N-acetylglucosamine synthase-like glycosyltransferase